MPTSSRGRFYLSELAEMLRVATVKLRGQKDPCEVYGCEDHAMWASKAHKIGQPRSALYVVTLCDYHDAWLGSHKKESPMEIYRALTLDRCLELMKDCERLYGGNNAG